MRDYSNEALYRRLNRSIEAERVQETRDLLIDIREELRYLANRINNKKVITITFDRYQELIMAEEGLLKFRMKLNELKANDGKNSPSFRSPLRNGSNHRSGRK